MSENDLPHNSDSGIRLAKRLAEQLQCSRREAELYIENGAVQVDGVTVEHPGARVLPRQSITVAPGARPTPVPPVTILLHKPAGHAVAEGVLQEAPDLLTPEHWHQGQTPTPIRMLHKHFQHLQCLMALPDAASGLTVLTQDRRVVRHLTEDALHLEQECVAHVQGTLDDAGLERLRNGTAIAGRTLPRIKVSWQSEQHLRLALKGIDVTAVEAMCRGVGLQLLGLRRLRIGRIAVAGLAAGQWRYAMPWERF